MRTTLRALIVAATAAGTLALPAPAHAATITYLDCAPFGPHGLTCKMDGLAANPYYIRWYRDGSLGSLWNDRWNISMFCRVAPVRVEVRVVLGDMYGEDELTTSAVCGTVP